jgi:hypothetical protein
MYFVKLVDLTDEEVTEASSHLGISDMDHLVVDVKVNFG